MDAARRDRLRARLLRGFVLATTLLGLVMIVLGAVPSVEVYHDANGGLFARTVRTPLAWAYEIADVALAVVLIAGVPVFCAIVALVTPDAPSPDDERER